MKNVSLKQLKLSVRSQPATVAAVLSLVFGAVLVTSKVDRGGADTDRRE
jgi:hypothetical protein